MNLEKLFKIQAELDKRIVEKHGLQNEDLLDKKILALQVELGELAQNWRGFKFWSEDREPRTELWLTELQPPRNPLLEEYVDCLHFILSIGLEIGADDFLESYDDWSYMAEKNVVKIFSKLFKINWWILDDNSWNEYFDGFEYFMTLGRELSFTWEQIETAYLEKNKINHTRQTTGY